jgi:hypothetical protein
MSNPNLRAGADMQLPNIDRSKPLDQNDEGGIGMFAPHARSDLHPDVTSQSRVQTDSVTGCRVETPLIATEQSPSPPGD